MPKTNTKKLNNNKQATQKMVDFGTAIARFWKKYFDFDGVAQRSEYWFAMLFVFLVSWPLSVLATFDPLFDMLFNIPWAVATFIPGCSIMSRRFHDAGFSFKWVWLTIIIMLVIWVGCAGLSFVSIDIARMLMWLTFVGMFGFSIFWFIVTLLPSKLKNNPYRK